jgi:hypothetical protein
MFLITQDDEWDDPHHVRTFGYHAESVGFSADEERERQNEIFQRFSRDVLGNSSVDVTADDSEGPAPDSEGNMERIPGSG